MGDLSGMGLFREVHAAEEGLEAGGAKRIANFNIRTGPIFWGQVRGPSGRIIDSQIMMPNISIRFCYYVPQL